MILLTVGTQLPFDRLVAIVDGLAATLAEPVFAQVGRGGYHPKNMEWRSYVDPVEFESYIARCTLLISHAGIGTLVMAQKHGKPMILFPRRAILDEHRNDHQLATVRALNGRSGVRIAYDEDDLIRLLATPHTAPKPNDVLPDRVRLCGVLGELVRSEQCRLARR